MRRFFRVIGIGSSPFCNIRMVLPRTLDDIRLVMVTAIMERTSVRDAGRDATQLYYVYGAGGHAHVVIDVLRSCGIGVKDIFDDNPVNRHPGHRDVNLTREQSARLIVFASHLLDIVERRLSP